MKVLLATPEDFRYAELEHYLEVYDFEVERVPLATQRARGNGKESADAVVIVKPTLAAVVNVVRLTSEVLSRTTAARALLCSTQLTRPDRELVENCGVQAVVSPSSWQMGDVAERITGELLQMAQDRQRSFGAFIGSSLVMREAYEEIETVAALRQEPVLITGESGTGKELAAREIHERSRKGKKMLAINVAALKPELIESELFGHERGSFTGAVKRDGLLKEAGEGTVFLDEIGELQPDLQAKLLRFFEEKRVRPVGSNRWVDIEARVLLATNRNLEAMCQRNEFRRDLLERFWGFTVELPPLRRRKVDIPLLARHFLQECDDEYERHHLLSPGSLDPLFRHSWPGNVRSLRNAIRSAAAKPSPEGFVDERRLIKYMEREKPVEATVDTGLSPLPGSVEGSQPENPNVSAGDSPEEETYTIDFSPYRDSWKAVQDRAQKLYFKAVLEAAKGKTKKAIGLAGVSSSRYHEIRRKIEEE